jgi:hypothetical protein
VKQLNQWLSIRDLPGNIERLSERLTNLSADMATAKAHAADPVTIGSRDYHREAVAQVLGDRLESLPEKVFETRRVALGMYRGLRFGVILHPQSSPDVYLERAILRRDMLSREYRGPRAVLNALERLAKGYGAECTHVQQDLTIAEAQLRDYQSRLGRPFAHEGYLAGLTTLRDQLKVGLSGTTPASENAPALDAPELAQRIKSLKGANTIEAAPLRASKRHLSAEEPVTARILRKVEGSGVAAPGDDETDWQQRMNRSERVSERE